MDQKINYVGEFFKNNLTIDNFFSNADKNYEIKEIEKLKEIKTKQKELNVLSDELANIYEKKYGSDYKPFKRKIYLIYNGRADTYYFDFPSGQKIGEDKKDEEADIIELDYKRGEISLPCGYNPKYASVISKTYKYSVSQDNTYVSFVFLREEANCLLNDTTVSTDCPKAGPGRVYHSNFRKINGMEFVNEVFGTSLQNVKLDLSQVYDRYQRNKSFETIIKTAPEEIIERLLNIRTSENKQVHELMEIPKTLYKAAVDNGVILQVYALKDKIANVTFNYTDDQWIKLIKESKELEKQLKFYNINYDVEYRYSDMNTKECALLFNICNYMTIFQQLGNYYTAGKLMRYVVEESINQGFKRIIDFLTLLKDYLAICDTHNINPILYSSYLQITHDITQRNIDVKLTQEEENKFKEQYKDWNDVKIDDYVMIAPACSDDMKKEGNELNHCVASYIKRVIDGETLIYFLRKFNEKDKSLITLEVNNGAIVQARGNMNRMPLKPEIDIIDKIAKKLKLIVSY